ncbi:MAG: hypothetical protein ABL999_09890 [Pyrinomonadaceae bacterium]
MKFRSALAALAVVVFSMTVLANGGPAENLAKLAVGNDATAATEAARKLREMGPEGLRAILSENRDAIGRFKSTGEADANWKRLTAAIDAVAMQKDAYTSGLYWYTDLEAAKAAAKKQNKPILTLRLLGNLNEEFSCANSRLFRSILYPNSEISKYLRENYILHWKSVRPAPRITIDFGDGRKIERTITGNSIHYVLNPDGKVIDAIPGLYSPSAFLGYVKNADLAWENASSKTPKEQTRLLMEYRKKSFDAIKKGREQAVATAGVELTETQSGTLAILAAPMAVAKMVVVDEYSILRVYDDFAKFEASIKFDDWDKLAKIYAANAELDANSIAMIRRQNAKTGLTKAEFDGLFKKLDNFIALDTTRNDFLFHAKLYDWLNQPRGVGELEAFNARVYDQLFRTPNTDKWLGLYSSDVYTALDGNGIIK